MKKTLKRLASMVLAASMLFTTAPAAFAMDVTSGSNDNAGEASEADTAKSQGNTDIYTVGSDVVYYIAANRAGGSDKNDGTADNPMMTIKHAISEAEAQSATTLRIVLKSDIELSLEQVFNNSNMPITFLTDKGANHEIRYTGTAPIGTESGFMKAVSGAQVAFDGVNLAGSTGVYDGRVIYVADDAAVSLENMTVSNGRVANVMNNEGGAGAKAADKGTLTVGAGVTFENNQTVAGGGAIFVADGGKVTISDDATIQHNEARLGGGIYADTQTKAYGGLEISGDVKIENNTATENGSGMYVSKDANASVAGDVQINANNKGREKNNVYLSDGATLDITGATTTAQIGISAEPEEAYRLVSLPQNYTIQPTQKGDEAGWSDDCGAWDIRHMTYNGVEGLYLYYKTLDVTFEDVNTLIGVTGKDINGENVDYLAEKDNLPNISVTGGVLTAAGMVAKNTPEDDDLTYTISVDKDEYRIPAEDVIKVTSGGKEVAHSYIPDFEAGTATITIDDAVVDTLTDTIKIEVSADKYYTLTVGMEGPLYAMQSSVTGLSESALVVTEQSVAGGKAHFKLMRSGKPLVGAIIDLYEEGTDLIGATMQTNAEGVADFIGLNIGKAYYPVIRYEDQYRVISRDVTTFNLSTLEGQTLAADCQTDEGATGHVDYDAALQTATVSGITKDAKVVFRVDQAQDVITFVGNEGDATTAPATVVPETKKMPAGAKNYGVLATATLEGYTFDGWYNTSDSVDAYKIDADTQYQSGVSPRTLYAHWIANTDTAYAVQHWVEYAAGGANAGYEEGVTETKVVDDKTYYLYDTTQHTDGTSDQVKDISGLDLKTMSDKTITWWTRDGFTASYEENCKVLANGTSKFSIYYNRNTYKLTFDAAGAGSVVSSSKFEPMDVKFGALVGSLPIPVLQGYTFGGWYEGDILYTATTVYSKVENTDLIAKWNANDDTKWAIKIAVQDIVKDPATGKYSAADTYTEYKTVYKNDNGTLLSTKLEGTSDRDLEFAIDSISALTFEGFNYVGYADAYEQTASNKVEATDKAIVRVKPTDMSTEIDGKFNENFDGGIVWLYYDRKTAHVIPDPTDPNGGSDGGDIIYGGDFNGQLPPDPSKPGYDFDGWVDKNDKPIDENTSANDYVEENGVIIVKPIWTPRNYRLTYVPGESATFVASNGGAGTANPAVPGGYKDTHDVTYDQPMGEMPSASKPGYVFDGWYLDDGTKINTDTVVSIDNVIIKNDLNSYEETRTLYARYTPHKYTLVFKPGESKYGDKGTVTPEKMVVTYDQILSGLPTPQLTGYTFVAWLLDLKNPSSAIKNGDKWTAVYTNNAEIPVYATWMPNKYKYTFDLNDSVGSTKGSLVDTTIDHVEEEFDSVYDGVFEVEAIRPGYKFMGWSLTSNGKPLTAADLVKISQDTTVYAVWEPIEYAVKFIMKGSAMPGDFEANNPGAVYSNKDDSWTIKVKFDSTYGALPQPTKKDSIFHSWLAYAPNWIEIHNQEILSLPAYTDYKDEAGITLTAVVEPLITFDPDGGKFEDGSTDPQKKPQSDIDKLPDVIKPGYDFDGWVTEKDPDKILDLDDVLGFEEPTVVKPHWSAVITFDANGGKMSMNNQDTLVIGLGKITEMPSASRSGFSLDGWYSDKQDGQRMSHDDLKKTNKPMTVYAHWSENTGGGGGGMGGGGSISQTYTITVETSEGVAATPNGNVKVTEGDDQSFEFKVQEGFAIIDVIVDGVSKGALDKYTFENVNSNHKLEVKAAKLLTGDHIAYIKGYPTGGVHPEANITRAEVAAIFYRLMSDEARAKYEAETSCFEDANANWAHKEIATLTAAGMLKGYTDGTFAPNKSITRAEFASIAARFEKLETGNKRFDDVSPSHWAYDAISSAAEKGWVTGYPDGTFRPGNKITRAEVVKITNAVMQRVCDKNYVDEHVSELTNYNDIQRIHWAYYEIMEASNAHDYESVNGNEAWTDVVK